MMLEVLERLSAPGGRAQVFERNGFKHDAGPTVITAPFLFDELFTLFGEKREDYLDFKPLDLWYRFYFDETGDTFDYAASIEKQRRKLLDLDQKMQMAMTGFFKHQKQFLMLVLPN